MSDELVIFRDLTDEELSKLTDDDRLRIMDSYIEEGVPERATVKGLLKELDVKYDDLTDFIQNMEVGICNYAHRTDSSISIYRKDSSLRDNISINLDDSRDVPDVTIQIQVRDDFVHEEAYNRDGLLIYQS